MRSGHVPWEFGHHGPPASLSSVVSRMRKPKPKPDDATQAISSEYLCGVRVGERVELIEGFVLRDERGRPTSVVHKPGEIWTVLPPSPDMPWRVLLPGPHRDAHAWPGGQK